MAGKRVGFNWMMSVVATGGADAARLVIGKAADVSLKVAGSEVDVSSRDSGGWKEFEEGQSEWTADADHVWTPTDATYAVLQAAKVAKTVLDFQFRDARATGSPPANMLGASGSHGFDGTGFIKDFEINQPLNGKVSVKLTIRGTGPLVPATVA